MLTSFGLYWVGEGAGVHWPGSDAAILGLIALFAVVTLGSVAWLRSTGPAVRAPATAAAGDEAAR